MNIRKHEKFEDLDIPKFWAAVMALVFTGLLLLLFFRLMAEVPTVEPIKNLKEHAPEIFYP